MTTALLLLAVFTADPQILTGRVISITDGDTLIVLDAAKVQHKIRLDGIDAPESKQPFGTKAKEALADRVHEKDVRIEWTTKDRYGRTLGRVYVGDRWINRELVETGHAWHYRQFSKSKELQAAEDLARKERRGLWADEKPVAPWDWRKDRKSPATSPTGNSTPPP